MLSTRPSSRSKWQRSKRSKWTILVLNLLLVLLLIPLPGNTKEKKDNSNRLPPAPDTGSPEEDFSAGGTRDNRHNDTVCGIDRDQIAYLLGNKNREFTSSAHPTFWFHIPSRMNQEAKVRFAVSELETGNKIYDRVIEQNKKSPIVGIDLPKEKQYALSPKVNYVWSLKVDCPGTSSESDIALEGWLTRSPLKSKLQQRLAATPEIERHTVYLQQNLLYDALTELAKRRIAKPNDIQIEAAWNQLLTKLGWQDLVQQKSATEPSVFDVEIGRKNYYSLSE